MRGYIELFETIERHAIGEYKDYTNEEKNRIKEIKEINIYYRDSFSCNNPEQEIINCLLQKDIELNRDKKLTELLK